MPPWPIQPCFCCLFLDGLDDHANRLDQIESVQPEQPCSYLGQCHHPSGCSSLWLFIKNTRFSYIFLPSYSPFLDLTEEFCFSFFSIAAEGLWQRPLHPCSPPPGHGGGLFRYKGWSLQGVDKGMQGFFPLLSGNGYYCMWCGWESLAWSRPETVCWCSKSSCTKCFHWYISFI